MIDVNKNLPRTGFDLRSINVLQGHPGPPLKSWCQDFYGPRPKNGVKVCLLVEE